jgi:hypothetical protein
MGQYEKLNRPEEVTTNYFRFLQHCFLTGEFCDLKIQTNRNDSINCHKLIITSVFPHLKELLEQVREKVLLPVGYFFS